MKRKLLSCVAIIGMITVGCTELQEELNKITGGNGTEQGGGENGGEVSVTTLDMQAQKEKLEGIGEELVNYADIDNWKDSFEAFLDFVAAMEGRHDTSAIEDMLEETGFFGNKTTVSQDYYDYGWYCNYKESSDETIYDESVTHFSKITGKYYLDRDANAWSGERASTFEVATTVNGERLAVAASVKDNDEKRLISERIYRSESTWEEYATGPAMYMNDGEPQYKEDEEGNRMYNFYNPVTGEEYGWIKEQYIWENYDAFMSMVSVPGGCQKRVETYNEYLYMPESLQGSFTRGNGSCANIEASLEYTPASAGEIDLSQDKFDLNFSFTVGNYTLKSTKIDILSGSADAGYVLSCSGTPVITMDVNETGGSVSKEKYESTYSSCNEDGSWSYTQSSSRTGYEINSIPEKAEITIDILGKLQIKGDANITKIQEILSGMEKEDEATLKAASKSIEEAFDLDIYYDGSSERSSSIGLEALYDESAGKWSVQPVIRFDDGSSYALFENFFNEDDFLGLLKSIASYEESVEEYLKGAFSQRETVNFVGTADANVWEYGAELRGVAQIDGLEWGRSYGFIYSDAENTLDGLKQRGNYVSASSMWQSQETSDSETLINFTATLYDELQPLTTYYYVPYVDIAGTKYFGEVKPFVSGDYGTGD